MKMDQIGLCQTWHVPRYEGSLRSVLSHSALQLNDFFFFLRKEGTALLLGKQQPDRNCKCWLKVTWARHNFLVTKQEVGGGKIH